jgi:hypothetical protein
VVWGFQTSDIFLRYRYVLKGRQMNPYTIAIAFFFGVPFAAGFIFMFEE